MKNKEFSKTLSRNNLETNFLSKIKVKYRAYICPFGDILDIIGNNKSIFDIGCGSGMFLTLCAEYNNPKKLAGIEINQSLIKDSQSLLSHYKIPLYLRTFNGKTIPNVIKNYDVITIIDVLHHISLQNQDAFLKNIIKQMGKGSILIIKDIDKSSPLVIFNKIHDIIFSRQFSHERAVDDIIAVLRKNKVDILSSSKRRMFIYPHYIICIRK